MNNPNIKPVPLDIAEAILLDAGDAIRARLNEHGHTERSFKMIAELWSVYITHAYTIRGETGLKAHDIAMLMDLLKTARSVYGYSTDNFKDKAGYSALGGLLTPEPEAGKPVIKGTRGIAELFPKPIIGATGQQSEVPTTADKLPRNEM